MHAAAAPAALGAVEALSERGQLVGFAGSRAVAVDACRRRGRASASPDMGARIRTRSRAAHREEKLKERQEAAALTQKLLQASASGGGVAKSGKVVNAYGQEEVGISRREAKASALRDMYASSTEKGVRRVIFADKL